MKRVIFALLLLTAVNSVMAQDDCDKAPCTTKATLREVVYAKGSDTTKVNYYPDPKGKVTSQYCCYRTFGIPSSCHSYKVNTISYGSITSRGDDLKGKKDIDAGKYKGMTSRIAYGKNQHNKEFTILVIYDEDEEVHRLVVMKGRVPLSEVYDRATKDL